MNGYSYSPFRSALPDLTGAELAVLRGVSEGWYVDYKERPPAIKDLARHLSAFANQHGGWLFLGVVEDTANGMVAGSFPGLLRVDVDKALVQLREASSAHVTPEVLFETKIIDGPVPEIGLLADRSIIVVGIPESDDTPHVHSSGRIYRRVADQSDPKHETDRHVLDRLWERRIIAKQRLADFLSSASDLTVNGQPCLLIYLLPHRTITNRLSGLTYDSFGTVMATAESGSQITYTKNNIFPVSGGYIARDTLFNDPGSDVPSFRWWFDGRVRITIPLDSGVGLDRLPRYETASQFEEVVRRAKMENYVIADLSLCMGTITCAISKYVQIRKLLGWTAPFYAAVQMHNILRIVPFVNSAFYTEQIRKWSVPVIQDDSFFWPLDLDPSSLIELIEPDTLESEEALIRPLLMALPLLVSILRSMGIVLDLLEQPTHVQQTVDGIFEAIRLSQLRRKP
jgi:hypothetical protein